MSRPARTSFLIFWRDMLSWFSSFLSTKGWAPRVCCCRSPGWFWSWPARRRRTWLWFSTRRRSSIGRWTGGILINLSSSSPPTPPHNPETSYYSSNNSPFPQSATYPQSYQTSMPWTPSAATTTNPYKTQFHDTTRLMLGCPGRWWWARFRSWSGYFGTVWPRK